MFTLQLCCQVAHGEPHLIYNIEYTVLRSMQSSLCWGGAQRNFILQYDLLSMQYSLFFCLGVFWPASVIVYAHCVCPLKRQICLLEITHLPFIYLFLYSFTDSHFFSLNKILPFQECSEKVQSNHFFYIFITSTRKEDSFENKIFMQVPTVTESAALFWSLQAATLLPYW